MVHYANIRISMWNIAKLAISQIVSICVNPSTGKMEDYLDTESKITLKDNFEGIISINLFFAKWTTEQNYLLKWVFQVFVFQQLDVGSINNLKSQIKSNLPAILWRLQDVREVGPAWLMPMLFHFSCLSLTLQQNMLSVRPCAYNLTFHWRKIA